MLDVVTHVTKQPVEYVVIWMHGLGADGYDFLPLAEQIESKLNVGVEFVFPHAPIMPVTINGGMEMRAWYDILNIDLERKVDSLQINSSTNAISQIIDEKKRQYNLLDKNVVLAGFSQGGVIALHQYISNPAIDYAGILALSTYYHDLSSIRELSETPVYLAHGTQDPVVDISLAENLKDVLEANNANFIYKTYVMQHQVTAEQIGEIVDWLNVVMK